MISATIARCVRRAGVTLLAVNVVTLVAAPASAEPGKVQREPAVALARVQHHLHEVDQIAAHFDTVVHDACPHFSSAEQWRSYFDGEVEQMVTLAAHIEQAWVEAKTTGDDDVRRTAKAPRKRLGDARAVIDKLQTCAADNGTSFGPDAVYRRIEREIPARQEAIALPE